MSDERGPHFPPSDDPWNPAPQTPPAADPWTSTPAGHGSYGRTEPTPAAYGSYVTPEPAYGSTGTGWPAQPPAATPPAPEKRTPYTAIATVALVAALIGGGVGGTIAANSDDDVKVSSLGAPLSSTDVKPAAAAAAGTVERVAAKVLPSVISIEVADTRQGSGSGSGVVISSDGLILTNNHVAGQGELSVTFSDGRTTTAKLIKADPSTDLAVIKADGVTDAVPIGFGSSGDLRVGQDVVAIGAPLGLAGTVTTGIVSALRRPVIPQEAAGGAASVIDGIQTDAPINPGNSGGALVDLNGNLVGITSAIASLGSAFGGQSGSIGLGFAIPIDQARIIAEQLAKGQTVAHALLGVQVTNPGGATARGAMVQSVTAGGAAEKAGLKKGDVVTRMDDRVIDTSDALVAGVRSQQPGTRVKLTYIRDGQTRTTEATLGSDQS